jgi:hypothetical protein
MAELAVPLYFMIITPAVTPLKGCYVRNMRSLLQAMELRIDPIIDLCNENLSAPTSPYHCCLQNSKTCDLGAGIGCVYRID